MNEEAIFSSFSFSFSAPFGLHALVTRSFEARLHVFRL